MRVHQQSFLVRGAAIAALGFSMIAIPAVAQANSGAAAVEVEPSPSELDFLEVPELIEPGDPQLELSPQQPLSPMVTDSEGSVSARAASFSPAGCKAAVDYPHSSNGKIRTQNGPYVSVHGRVKCDVAVSRVTATTYINRVRWFGEEHYVTGANNTQYNSKITGDSTPHGNCVGAGTYTYVGYTKGVSVEGTTTYVGEARNTTGDSGMSRFTC